jgi:hypothetical protein
MTMTTTPQGYRIDLDAAERRDGAGAARPVNSARLPVAPTEGEQPLKTVSVTSRGYVIEVDVMEREQLLVACEYALSQRRGEQDGARMLLDLDAEHLDTLCDRLFLVSHAA